VTWRIVGYDVRVERQEKSLVDTNYIVVLGDSPCVAAEFERAFQ
jgi:hypothetical protein